MEGVSKIDFKLEMSLQVHKENFLAGGETFRGRTVNLTEQFSEEKRKGCKESTIWRRYYRCYQ